MNIWEAIRLGATLKKQARGTFERDGIRTCALGSALDAVGKLKQKSHNVLERLWPDLYLYHRPGLSCPVRRCPSVQPAWWKLVIHLNDDHRWTRERIADYLEIQMGPPPMPEEVPETKGEPVYETQ